MFPQASCLILLHVDSSCLLRLGTKSANLKTALFPMKLHRPLISAVAAIALIGAAPRALQAKSDAEQICVSVGRLLEDGQYSTQHPTTVLSLHYQCNYYQWIDDYTR